MIYGQPRSRRIIPERHTVPRGALRSPAGGAVAENVIAPAATALSASSTTPQVINRSGAGSLLTASTVRSSLVSTAGCRPRRARPDQGGCPERRRPTEHQYGAEHSHDDRDSATHASTSSPRRALRLVPIGSALKIAVR